MKLTIYIQIIFLICFGFSLSGQDTLRLKNKIDSVSNALQQKKVPLDSMLQKSDTVRTYPISENAIEEPLEYGSRDTQWVEIKEKKIHLYGEAFIKSGQYDIKAGYIVFDFEKNEAFAQAIKDPSGTTVGKPTFSDGSQQFTYEKLRYNFETKNGIVYNAFTQQGQLYIHGAITKFVSKDDSIYMDDQVFNKDALITTCDLEQPHYGIRTSKLKLVPDKLAVIGPARLEIAGVPTPLFIPFAFMPVLEGQRSGIIFGGQQGFESSPLLGFGFREIGYYFALNDYVDLRVTGDIYTRGTWALRLASNYSKRYKYRGNLQLGFSRQIIELENQLLPNINQSFSFGLSHNQDSKFHPYMTLGGNLRFTTNDYDRRNFNDAQSQLENIINSNFRFTHSLPGLDPLSLSVTLGHSQNTRTRRIDFTLPDVQLRMKTVYPFKRKGGAGEEKWYEKINVQLNSKFKNFVTTFDTVLFTKQTLENLQTGVSHDARAGASFNILEHFTFNPRLDYDELWFFKSLDKSFDPTLIVDPVTQDTTYGTVTEQFNTGFDVYRDFKMGFDLTTNIFGTLQFNKGWLRGLRHVIRPSIGFNFSPSTEHYYREVQLDSRDTTNTMEYNPFSGGIFRTPSFRGKQMAIVYNITNIFEGKYYSKKDSTEKKFKIFNNINVNGNYNFAADSLRWSQVNISGTARFFSGFSTLTIGAVFDPYMEKNNRRINTTVWSQKKRLLRFERFGARISTSFSVSQLKSLFSGKKSTRSQSSGKNEKYMDESILDMLDNFRVSHIVDLLLEQKDGVNEFTVKAHSLRFQGSIPLTDNWSAVIGNFSYDFKNGSFVYPTLGLTRDLHCWNFNFNWQPQRGTYSFFIGVKTSQLSQFLKYNYGRNQFDALF